MRVSSYFAAMINPAFLHYFESHHLANTFEVTDWLE